MASAAEITATEPAARDAAIAEIRAVLGDRLTIAMAVREQHGKGEAYHKPAPPDVMAKVGQIEAVCRAHNVALADAALRFALAHPAVSSVVLGAVAPSEIERQRQSFTAKIPAALWSDLKAKGLLDKSCPVPA